MVFAVIDSNDLSSISSRLRLAHKKKWIPSLLSLGHTIRDLHSPHTTRLPQTPTAELENWSGTFGTEVRGLELFRWAKSQRTWMTATNLLEHRLQVCFPLLTPSPRSPSTAEVFLPGEWQRSGIHSSNSSFPCVWEITCKLHDGLTRTTL